MRQLKAEELSFEAFNPFGQYASMINPKAVHRGAPPIEFYRDMVPLNLGGAHLASFSVCRVEKRPAIIDKTEFHAATGEGILPLDNDVLIHVGPATKPDELPLDQFRVFRVPKGTFVALKPGVWHHAPIVVNADFANVLIVLPERAYANDCGVVGFSDEQKIKVIM